MQGDFRIPIFVGNPYESWRFLEWVTDIEDYFEIYDITLDGEKFKYAERSFVKVAKTWLWNLQVERASMGRSLLSSWSKLKDSLYEEYFPKQAKPSKPLSDLKRVPQSKSPEIKPNPINHEVILIGPGKVDPFMDEAYLDEQILPPCEGPCEHDPTLPSSSNASPYHECEFVEAPMVLEQPTLDGMLELCMNEQDTLEEEHDEATLDVLIFDKSYEADECPSHAIDLSPSQPILDPCLSYLGEANSSMYNTFKPTTLGVYSGCDMINNDDTSLNMTALHKSHISLSRMLPLMFGFEPLLSDLWPRAWEISWDLLLEMDPMVSCLLSLSMNCAKVNVRIWMVPWSRYSRLRASHHVTLICSWVKGQDHNFYVDILFAILNVVWAGHSCCQLIRSAFKKGRMMQEHPCLTDYSI